MAVAQNLDQLAHSPLGASSYERWGECPGSVKLSQGIKSTSSVYAEEGTKAHEIGANILEGKSVPSDADPAMLEAVAVYVDYVRNCMTEFKDETPILMVEQRFSLAAVHPLLFGTSDAVIYYPKRKLLRVIDYKHGQGVAVEVENNRQLMYYGLGALMMLGKPCTKIELTVVQPRCYHKDGPIRTWSSDMVDMLEFRVELREKALATEAPDAPIVPAKKGKDYCRWCPAKSRCPALATKASAVAKNVFGEVSSLEGEKVAEALEMIPALESFINGVRERAYALASKGEIVPGWKLVPKRASRKWTSETDVIKALKKILAKDLDKAFDTSLKSVSQIEKLLGKEMFTNISPFVTAISTGNTLVPDTDSRPGMKDVASEVFNDAARLLE